MESLRKYSVFLTPAAEDFAYCEALIREFSDKFDVPPFEPHVTVHSGTFTDHDELKAALTAAARGMKPFSLNIRGIGCTEEYFKTLFIEFEEDATLRALFERIRSGLREGSGYRLFPHLSLLYNEMPLRDKQALARRVRLDRKSIMFDQIKIATALNVQEGWRDTARWQTVFRIRLGASDTREVDE